MQTEREHKANKQTGRAAMEKINRDDIFVRTRAMFGDRAMERLYGASVAVFGLGGVGGHATEALARAGI